MHSAVQGEVFLFNTLIWRLCLLLQSDIKIQDHFYCHPGGQILCRNTTNLYTKLQAYSYDPSINWLFCRMLCRILCTNLLD